MLYFTQIPEKRLPVLRSVHQGFLISPFLFLLVVQLLLLHIQHNPITNGTSIFGKDVELTQFADDTALYLRDKYQVEYIVSLIDQFSSASGLILNKSKCEIRSLYQTEGKKLYIC